jgi:twinfilin
LVQHLNAGSFGEMKSYVGSGAEPAFFFYRFDHEFQGEHSSPVLFIFYCPDKSHVKLRMLYSTVKSTAIETASSNNVNVAKKMEASEGDDLVEDEILNDLHPAAREQAKASFARPARPGKGPSRMTRKK